MSRWTVGSWFTLFARCKRCALRWSNCRSSLIKLLVLVVTTVLFCRYSIWENAKQAIRNGIRRTPPKWNMKLETWNLLRLDPPCWTQQGQLNWAMNRTQESPVNVLQSYGWLAQWWNGQIFLIFLLRERCFHSPQTLWMPWQKQLRQ